MVKKYKNFISLLLLLFNFTYSQTIVTASVDANRISQNETLGLKIVATNADGTPSVDISPILKDFKIISGPAQQTNIQWINGAMTSSRSLTWTLLAKNDGKINIPSLNVTVQKKVFRTNPIGISVEKGAGRAQMANLFIEAKADKEQAFPGEQITVTYRLFTRLNLSIEDIEYPKSTGFWNEDLRIAQTIRFNNTKINGVDYKVATLYKSALFPTQTGNLTIAPMTAICNVEIPSRGKSNNPFNDAFFNSMFKETQRQFIQSDSINIIVNKYPNSPPSDFSGAVGKFEITSMIDTPIIKINEAITFRVKLKGTGNLNQFNINSIDFPQNMEVFPPTSSFERNEFRDDITGEQNFEYILIPRISGQFILKPVKLTYFDPNLEKFIISSSEPLPLTINPGDKTNIASTQFNKENVALLGNDIRHIKILTPEFYSKGEKTIPIWVWGTYIFATTLFIFPTVLSRFKANRISTYGQRKSQGALRVAIKQLSKPTDDLFALTSLVFYKYFQSKLFLSSENLDPLTIESQLKGKIDNSLLKEIVSITKICDAGRFGPEADTQLPTLKEQALHLLKKVDKVLS
jgi:hypothetical protein